MIMLGYIFVKPFFFCTYGIVLNYCFKVFIYNLQNEEPYILNYPYGSVVKVDDADSKKLVERSKQKLDEVKKIINELDKQEDLKYKKQNEAYYTAEAKVKKQNLTIYNEHIEMYESLHDIDHEKSRKKYKDIQKKIDDLLEEINLVGTESFSIKSDR